MKNWSALLLLFVLIINSCGSDDSPEEPIETGEPEVVRVVPSLTFTQPVMITNADIGNDFIFVVEKPGTIRSIADMSATESPLFLDIRDRVNNSGTEQGLLGLAFHPQFSSNGFFYVYYIGANNQSVISRFGTDATGGVPATEEIILEVPQPFGNHNGGMIAFGPDGYLYIALGDGGSANDPLDTGQDRTDLLGSILRIDVDNPASGLAYGIPADNPYTGNTEGLREEIYAYGLRNPFRFSFDSQTGRLYTGDVGQNRIEEIDEIVSGGNYGWNTMEGSECFSGNCDTNGLILPIAEYDHSVGQSVTGGNVYRGRDLPTLVGHYFYADFVTGVLFSLNVDIPNSQPEQFATLDISVSSFGEDELGNIYLCDFSGGGIYSIRNDN
ncbi:MAG: PQQ-dependent sugar dehydrogenase [Roseivirga sp.]|nr:PQQ-dependent sugar dehydrogenase [Roseivirga sp.]